MDSGPDKVAPRYLRIDTNEFHPSEMSLDHTITDSSMSGSTVREVEVEEEEEEKEKEKEKEVVVEETGIFIWQYLIPHNSHCQL